MSASVVVHREELASLPLMSLDAWRSGLVEQVRAGRRPLILFGIRRTDDVVLTAVLQEPDRSLRVLRTVVDPHRGYHSLTADVPAFHCFEREVHEQTGIRIAGHPWLKPLRSDGPAGMADYPYYKIDGKEVHEVAVGPVHAGVIEPGSFRFSCLGEQVHHLEIQLGYQNRGVEPRLLKPGPARLKLVETIAGDSSIAHAWAYCAAIEALSGYECSIQVEAWRAVALELERIAMHLSGLAGLAADVGFLQGATTYGRLRTTAINTSMLLFGSRFGRGALRPGGIRMSLSSASLAQVASSLQLLSTDLPIINACFLGAHSVRHRLEGVGKVSTSDALALGLVGMAARASGVAIDLRDPMAHGIYGELPIEPQVLAGGDCWARARIRIAELDVSIVWLQNIIQRYPQCETSSSASGASSPDQLVIALVEGWRGEVVHCLETDQVGNLVHYKVQDPSLRNWMGLARAMRHNEISDFPICNKSFDLSYCGNDL